jgi:hypothetical protein
MAAEARCGRVTGQTVGRLRCGRCKGSRLLPLHSSKSAKRCASQSDQENGVYRCTPSGPDRSGSFRQTAALHVFRSRRSERSHLCMAIDGT